MWPLCVLVQSCMEIRVRMQTEFFPSAWVYISTAPKRRAGTGSAPGGAGAE